jgi:hypothetical protein
MSNTRADPVNAALEAWKEAANRHLAEAMRDSRMASPSQEAQKQAVASLKAEADRLFAAAMEKLREARAAMQ